VQQIEIEIIRTKTSEARLASGRDAAFRRITGPQLGDQEYAIALASNDAADEFLGAALAVDFRSVDQRHPKRKASAQCCFLNIYRVSAQCKLRGALAQRRDDGAVAELYRSLCAVYRIQSQCP
jgi:hypothetical protein